MIVTPFGFACGYVAGMLGTARIVAPCPDRRLAWGAVLFWPLAFTAAWLITLIRRIVSWSA